MTDLAISAVQLTKTYGDFTAVDALDLDVPTLTPISSGRACVCG